MADEWTLRTETPEGTAAFGRALGRCAGPGDVLLLYGPVGAGKTVLGGGVLEGLGIPAPHPSPTFTLVRTYRGRLPAIHADLYRLHGGFDPDELGWDELADEETVTLVEWPERLGPHTPADALVVRMQREAGSDGCRRLTLRASGPSSRRWLRAAMAPKEAYG